LKQYYVNIMANVACTVLYTGVTNDLLRRVLDDRTKLTEGFTKRYNVRRLVYYEVAEDPYTAIAREKQIKAGSRTKKMELIDAFNPTWRDLYDEIVRQ
jgi:putative endonuclease